VSVNTRAPGFTAKTRRVHGEVYIDIFDDSGRPFLTAIERQPMYHSLLVARLLDFIDEMNAEESGSHEPRDPIPFPPRTA
jgi:hypothetical protein